VNNYNYQGAFRALKKQETTTEKVNNVKQISQSQYYFAKNCSFGLASTES